MTNEIAKNTMYMYLRMFFVMTVSLFTVRVVLKTLGVNDYGVYSAVGGIVSSLSFMTNVLAIASQRFFSVEIGKGNNDTLKDTFSTIILIYIILGFLVIVLSETIGLWFLNNKMTIPIDRFEAAIWVFQCSVVSFFFSVITAPYQAMIISKEKMNIYAYVGILDVILKLLLVYLLSVLNFDKLIVYAILMLVVSFLCNSIYALYCYMYFEEVQCRLCFNKSIFREIFGFSSWTFFGSIAYMFNSQGVNLVLNVFFGPVVNAAYAISNQVKTAINSFSSNFYVAVRPALIKSYAAEDYSYVERLFYFSTKLIFVLLFVCIFPVASHISTILHLWLGTIGEYMSEFVVLMLIYAIVLSMSDPITTIVQAANKVKYYHLIVDGFTLLTLPLSYFAYKVGFPPITTFIVSIVIYIVAHFIRLEYLTIIFPSITIMSYVKKVIAPIIFTLLLTVALSFVLSSVMKYSLIIEICNFGVDFILSICSCYFIVFTKDEKRYLITLMKDKLRKKR